jgi:hypothetical protein
MTVKKPGRYPRKGRYFCQHEPTTSRTRSGSGLRRREHEATGSTSPMAVDLDADKTAFAAQPVDPLEALVATAGDRTSAFEGLAYSALGTAICAEGIPFGLACGTVERRMDSREDVKVCDGRVSSPMTPTWGGRDNDGPRERRRRKSQLRIAGERRDGRGFRENHRGYRGPLASVDERFRSRRLLNIIRDRRPTEA